jgi:serine/threonine protein kinase/Tol biopolymer transport system component
MELALSRTSTPARLRDVFDKAVELSPVERQAYLTEACTGDTDLRQAIERLLSADARLGDLFTSWVSLSPAADLDGGPAAPAFRPGGRVGPYDILASLGAGGMGEVYSARDSRLDRRVAVKVISRRLSSDPGARDRFTREARAIAALPHPHICQLFDVGHHDGIDFLVMEYVPGETLASRLTRGRMPRDEALRHSLEIADALGAAHRAGIVHRDLKPANIMMTPAGAKLLDFGLAGRRTVVADAPGQPLDPQPAAGRVMGTLPYIAPEVIEGAEADERADIFAFGAVLFEMLAGRRAFDGTTATTILMQILGGPAPSLAASNRTTPKWLDRIVAKCLAASPDRRFRSMGEVEEAMAAGGRTRRRRTAIAAAIVVAAAGVAALALVPESIVIPPQVTSIRRVSYDGTLKDVPYTDGRDVFYLSWGGGFASTTLFRAPVSGGHSSAIRTPFAKPYLLDLTPAGELLLVDSAEDAPRLHLMSPGGGSPRPVGTIEAHFADLSDDGRRLLFNRDSHLFVADADGSHARELLVAPGSIVLPRWAPDGRRIRYTVSTPGARTIWEATIDGDAPRVVLAGWFAGCGKWTPDGRHFVFEAERDGEYGLWVLPDVPGGSTEGATPTKLTTGPLRFENAVPSPDGVTVLALGTPPPSAELARFDLHSKQFVQELDNLPAGEVEFSPDGRSVAYVRSDDGTLWRARVDGSEGRQLTVAPHSVLPPRWSPDGRRIAFALRREGRPWQSFVVTAAGGSPTQVTAGDLDETDPSWNSDGSKVALGGVDVATRRSRLHIVDLASGRSEIIPGSDGLFSPRWSPDGAMIAALSRTNDRLLLYDVSTKRWRELLRGGVGWPSWDRRSAYIQVQLDARVVRVRIADGRVEPLVDLSTVRQAVSVPMGASWLGVALDGAPLILRQVGSASEYYALTVDWHD